jgi:NADPH:quinone reductase-like Zn-dependent oxidoreductase
VRVFYRLFIRTGVPTTAVDSHHRGGCGVDSIEIQRVKTAGLVVIATASRPETESWVKALGADHVVNHREPMAPQVRALGFQQVDHIAIFNDTRHQETAAGLIRPQGAFVSIDNPDLPMPMAGMKSKAASLHCAVDVRSRHAPDAGDDRAAQIADLCGK